METNFFRRLIFPPMVLGILAGLFHVFEIFDVLLARDEKLERMAIATHVPPATLPRAVVSSSAKPRPFSPSPSGNHAPTLGEFAKKPDQTNWPPQIPVNLAVASANLPSATPNPIESEGPENVAPPDEVGASAPPGYQAPAYTAGELVVGSEMPKSEMVQPNVQGLAAGQVTEEPMVDEQEPPQ